MPLRRTQYWNTSTGTVRNGDTAHGESVTDIESYLEPLARARTVGLHSWGVARGLRVGGSTGSRGVRIGPGAAVDASGRLIVLEAGGVAVVVEVDPDQVVNVPTVVVGPEGVTVDTASLTAGRFLATLTWREVQDSQVAGAPTLVHAPWVRLTREDGFADTGAQVVLAAVDLDDGGAVTAIAPGPRRLAGVQAGRVELRVPREEAGPGVGQTAVARLSGRPDGGVDLALVDAAGEARQTLSLVGRTGDLRLPAGLLQSGAGGRTYRTSAGPDGAWRLTDQDRQAERLVVDGEGLVGIGTGGRPLMRSLHVEGTGVHSGGAAGGYSFADRVLQDFVVHPAAGERWVWYAEGGRARLWSSGDKLTVTAGGRLGIGVADPAYRLDVNGRVCLRQAGESSAGLWFIQDGTAERAFVGMASNDEVGFWGNTGVGWGLKMDTTSGAVTLKHSLTLPKTGDGSATFTSRVFDNEVQLTPNNLKLQMGSRHSPQLGNPLRFEFMVGWSMTRAVGLFLRTNFVRVFGVDQDGHAFFAAGKGGYVVDYFVNATGDTLEQGDVVVLGIDGPADAYGSHDDIPVPEVDLTERAYDTRVCGIVADVVAASSLPGIDPQVREPEDEEGAHPLARFAGAADQERTRVGDRQMGRMVTLGAWAHCKVDADVAPIAVGDLLTTSATRGHAQKAEDRGAAVGAVVGKAMAALESGRGVIPVLVSMQ